MIFYISDHYPGPFTILGETCKKKRNSREPEQYFFDIINGL